MTIELVKSKINIVDLIAEKFEITGRGRVRSTKEHDSLKIWTETQSWYWYSKGQGGDIFDWYIQQHRCDFYEALEVLASQAGVELKPLTDEQRQANDRRREEREILETVAHHFNLVLNHHPGAEKARTYCSLRGWDRETIEREQVGVRLAHEQHDQWDGLSLMQLLQQYGWLEHPLAQEILRIPVDHIVYVHRRRGAALYLSARSIKGKRHYNLELANLELTKQPYVNWPVANGPDVTVLVEGQADAIALSQMGVHAVALCGLFGYDLPGNVTHVAFDNDEAGLTKALNTALEIDPLCRILDYQGLEATDPADHLEKGFSYSAFFDGLSFSLTAIEHLAQRAGQASGEDRTALVKQFFDIYTGLDDMVATDMKPDLAKSLCGGVAQFNRLLKAHAKATEAESSPERYEYSSGGAKGGHIWEQCVVFDAAGIGKSLFAVRKPDNKIEIQTSVDVGGISYIPYPADTGIIEKGVVLFPEKPQDYGSQKQLVAEIQKFIHTYLDVDHFYEKLAAYYVLFSWVYDLFENLPYLRALGDYGTGKTRFLQAIGVLCYRPMFVSGASTVSPIFRLIDMFKGTLIIDEADFSNSDAEAEIIKIMNVGYYSKGNVLRSEKEMNTDSYMPSVSMVYGPKIMATRKPFSDRATESRCLTKRMTTARPRPGIPYVLGAEFWADATAIRNKLLQYRLQNYRPITIDPSLADESVEPRLNQVTMALKSIVDSEEMRSEIDIFIRSYNETLIYDRQMTLPAVVVQALVDIHYEKGENILGEDTRDFTMKGIAKKVQELLDDIDPDTRMTAQKVGKVLSEELGLTKRSTHPRNRRAILEYEIDDLKSLMKRYGIVDPEG